VSRSIGLAHIVRQDDGTSTGIWGPYRLKSAFQPIFAIGGGKLDIVAFEGLLRPFREEAALAPENFFSLVTGMDRLHVETLSRTLHLLNAGAFLGPHALIFVNFDPSVFVERAVADSALRDMRLVLHEAKLDPSRIVCELTERHTPSQEALFNLVSALRRHGFQIAVDDYGAAESDMNRIRDLTPDIVKFDAHWIGRLMETAPGFGLLKTLVGQFEEQGIRTVFEGIEESWQVDLAARCGVTMAQGYALALPELAPTRFAAMPEAGASEPASAVSEGMPMPSRERPETGRLRAGGRVASFGRRMRAP
jgi:EAL domain-containing protein (putative c-di-GMP-specific phosphodiesterase class I)